jgi:hypothetical protein
MALQRCGASAVWTRSRKSLNRHGVARTKLPAAILSGYPDEIAAGNPVRVPGRNCRRQSCPGLGHRAPLFGSRVSVIGTRERAPLASQPDLSRSPAGRAEHDRELTRANTVRAARPVGAQRAVGHRVSVTGHRSPIVTLALDPRSPRLTLGRTLSVTGSQSSVIGHRSRLRFERPLRNDTARHRVPSFRATLRASFPPLIASRALHLDAVVNSTTTGASGVPSTDWNDWNEPPFKP